MLVILWMGRGKRLCAPSLLRDMEIEDDNCRYMKTSIGLRYIPVFHNKIAHVRFEQDKLVSRQLSF